MADLLIKGLRMPKEHEIIVVDQNGMACLYDERWDGLKEPVRVAELPPHGNLIDEQAYRASVKEFLCKDCHESCYACKVVDVMRLLDYAPTVIPKTED